MKYAKVLLACKTGVCKNGRVNTIRFNDAITCEELRAYFSCEGLLRRQAYTKTDCKKHDFADLFPQEVGHFHV